MAKRKLAVLIFATLLSVSLVVYVVFNIVFSPYWDSVYTSGLYMSLASYRDAATDTETFTKKEACADIDYLLKRLKRVHPAFIDGLSDNVTECAEREKEAFGDEVTAYDIWRACARVLHETGDANSMCTASFPMNYLTAHYEMLGNGCEVAAINGVPVEQIFKDNSELVSYESEPWGVNVVKGLVGTREGLKFLGIYGDTLEYTYAYQDGSTAVRTYKYDDFYNSQAADDTQETVYSCDIIKDEDLAVMKLDECVYDDGFRQFVYDFFKEVTDNKIENIVIDLRDNSGGTSAILDEILIYLDHDEFTAPGGDYRMGPYMMHWDSEKISVTHMDDVTIFTGNVYLLTSSDTFSAATLMAGIMRDNEFCTIAGEECGNLPQSYGEVAAFQTPNAAITFQVSTKLFKRVDQNKAGDPLEPDIKCGKREALLAVTDIIRNK